MSLRNQIQPTKTQHKPFLRSPLSGDLLDESKSQVFGRYVGKYDRGELDYLADPQPPPPPPNVAAKEAAISESDALTRALQVFNKYTMKYIEAKGKSSTKIDTINTKQLIELKIW